jgi:hypothetical protein
VVVGGGEGVNERSGRERAGTIHERLAKHSRVGEERCTAGWVGGRRGEGSDAATRPSACNKSASAHLAYNIRYE